MGKKAKQHEAAVQTFLDRRVREGDGRGTFQYTQMSRTQTQQDGLLLEATYVWLYATITSTLTALIQAYTHSNAQQCGEDTYLSSGDGGKHLSPCSSHKLFKRVADLHELPQSIVFIQ